MLIRHTLRYLPAQVVSPLAQLASMVLWTHWLPPNEMGVFTLVTVAQEIAYLACLGWFAIYALRYLPAPSDQAAYSNYLCTENATAVASLLGSLVAAAIVTATLPEGFIGPGEVGLITAFFATKAFNAHYAERARAQSAFAAYTLLQTAGPLGGLLLGWLAMHHYGASSSVLIAAYAAAQGLGTALALPRLGMHWRLAWPDTALLRAAMAFGGPMLFLQALGWLGENYVRYIVQWQVGASSLGLMVVGWALGRRAASVAAMLVTTAAFPIASRLLNEGRRDEAIEQLRTNAALLISVLLPVTVGVKVLGPLLVTLVVAPQYRDVTSELLGLAMIGGALRNLHVHVTDQWMVLERRIRMLAALDVFEIGLCAFASLIGLRLHGLHGAVIGQALGSALALGLSIWWAGSRLQFRWPWADTGRIALASAVMYGVLIELPLRQDAWGLALGSGAGAVVYVIALGLLFYPALLKLRTRERANA